ncbi:MAG: Hpt domain-containing protein [Oscillospiraceae bacterium]|nr:Hpt domain-containing protein [Oscillospiraceae bacterium]
MATLIAIKDVDTELGIRTLGGDEALYIDVLGAFCEDIANWRAVIAAYPATASLKSLTTAVHGFKSAARNIGALTAGDLAAAIETAAKADDTAYVDANIAELLTMMNDLYERCSEVSNGG